ncbi:hypothetical protein Agub_g4489, partial [Astrephomene gubernaculifera]
DKEPDCEQQRYAGKCSTQLFQGLHTCMASCALCPALELAVRTSLNLTSQQLEIQITATTNSATPTKSTTSTTKPNAANDDAGCFDAADACDQWARSDPRVCQRLLAGQDLQRWWWVAVACRRTCGLCGEDGSSSTPTTTAAASSSELRKKEEEEEQNEGGAKAAAAEEGGGGAAGVPMLDAGIRARVHVQVGEGADGSPRVAVFEEVPPQPGACVDKQAGCREWAAGGECGGNPGFMSAACPAACHTCPQRVNLPHPLARVRLSNGVLMPAVGYGCAGLGEATRTTVGWALRAGYRHLDSAQAREWYREDLVGEAMWDFIAAAGAGGGGAVRREDIFVTSKLHPRHLGYETTLRQFNESLKDLRSPYVDLFLLHYAECWGGLCGGAVPAGDFLDSWRALEELYGRGLVRAIGVSNFSPEQLKRLLAAARVRPAVLQTHVDPLEPAVDLQTLCRTEGITLTAYSTLGTQYGGGGGGGNPVLGHPVLKAVGAEAGGRSAAAVSLRWALQQGLVVLPRSSNEGRIRDNLKLFDWELSEAQMRRLVGLRPMKEGET